MKLVKIREKLGIKGKNIWHLVKGSQSLVILRVQIVSYLKPGKK
jgi:hypothetical protein